MVFARIRIHRRCKADVKRSTAEPETAGKDGPLNDLEVFLSESTFCE